MVMWLSWEPTIAVKGLCGGSTKAVKWLSGEPAIAVKWLGGGPTKAVKWLSRGPISGKVAKRGTQKW